MCVVMLMNVVMFMNMVMLTNVIMFMNMVMLTDVIKVMVAVVLELLCDDTPDGWIGGTMYFPPGV